MWNYETKNGERDSHIKEKEELYLKEEHQIQL
ncbi:rCG36207 [Rattus norvegicus]|uniref:RCG36207 n=1 Tax=Rattus norvegicus TaxID=10116 RepID=A6IPQ4_RAT|nr:rCG36207 [Rattus norvegicus]